MTEKLLDHRERNAAQGELHPVGVPQRMGHGALGCGDTADRGETPQQRVHELLVQRRADVSTEQRRTQHELEMIVPRSGARRGRRRRPRAL